MGLVARVRELLFGMDEEYVDLVHDIGEAQDAEIRVVELIDDYGDGGWTFDDIEGDVEAALEEAGRKWQSAADVAAEIEDVGTPDQWNDVAATTDNCEMHAARVANLLDVLRNEGIDRFVETAYLDPDEAPTDQELLEVASDTDLSIDEAEDELYGDVPNIDPDDARETLYDVDPRESLPGGSE